VSRKVVKQTVMTSVYGVTIPGARAQVLARLSEVPALGVHDEQTLAQVALYVAQLTLASLGEVRRALMCSTVPPSLSLSRSLSLSLSLSLARARSRALF
jgi:DNA-directed RNA polymerase